MSYNPDKLTAALSKALDDEGVRDVSPPGAKCGAHGEFMAAAFRPHEQKVCDVGATDQQCEQSPYDRRAPALCQRRQVPPLLVGFHGAPVIAVRDRA